MAKKRAKKQTASKAESSGSEVPVRTRAQEQPAPAGGARLAPWEDLDRLFDDFLRRRWPLPFRFDWPAWSEPFQSKGPLVDIMDRDDEVVVRAEVPGVSKEDLDVSIVDRTLTIKGSTREEKQAEEDDYYRREIRSGSFSRTVLLPSDVDANKARASYKDGVVELTLPKLASSRRRKIPVS